MDSFLRDVLGEKAALLGDKGGALYSVKPNDKASEAIKMMCDANIGCVLVMDGGQLQGIFSERDVLNRVAIKNVTADTLLIRDVATMTELVTVTPAMSVADALMQCTDRRIRHLPVVEEGKLLGLLSIGDLVRSLVKDKERTISDLMEYIYGQQIES